MSYSSEVLADSPLAYWRLGEPVATLSDSSGNGRNGTYVGGPSSSVAGLVSGDSNHAHSFASGSRGQVTDAAWMDATSFTVMATITPSGTSGTQTVVARYGIGFSASSFSVRLDGNKVGFYIFYGGNNFSNITQSTTLTAGTTYDIAASYDGSTGAMTLYVNGSSVATGTRTGMNNASSDFTIGARYDGSEPFGGVIDDVSYFSSVLTGTQVSNFATQRASGSGYASSVLALSPLAYYRLNEASVGAMFDSSGNGRSGAYQGTPTPAVSGALVGDPDTATTFGTGKYASTTYASWQDVPSAVTLEAWVKVSTSGNYRHIITKDNGGTGGSNSQWQFRVSNVNKVEFLLWHSGLTQVTSATTLTNDTWYHVVATYSASTGVQAIYINGSLDASTSGLSGNVTTGTVPIMVGTSTSDGSPTYSGSMTFDELAVYNAALSATRVAAHYTAGTSGPSASGTASLSLSASGGAGAMGAGSASLSLSASGSTSAPAAGSASLSLSASGSLVPPVGASGSAALSLSASGGASGSPGGAASLNLVATGTALAVLAASGSATLTLSASGSAVMSAGGTAVLTLTAGGGAYALYETDTSNALDGLDLLLTATVIFPVPVATPPASVAAMHYDKALAYPTPTMVGGRPT